MSAQRGLTYVFPYIETIDDVMPYIEGCPDINPVKLKDGDMTMICYMVNRGKETFPDMAPDRDTAAFRRECRGLIFDRNGVLISRPYHKFFNIGERDETTLHVVKGMIDSGRPVQYLEKLDGSMVRPVRLGRDHWNDRGSLVMMTKKGFSDVGQAATSYFASQGNIVSFCEHLILAEQMTPIFEFCSRSNKVVLDHPKDRLVLTALRDTGSGDYIPFSRVQGLIDYHRIEVVKEIAPPDHEPTTLVEKVKALLNAEGMVVRFDNGHMVKMKSDWYVNIHGSLDTLRFEKDILRMVLMDQIDDLLPHLDSETAARLEKYAADVNASLLRSSVDAGIEILSMWKQCEKDRKRYAIEGVPALSGIAKPFAFMYLDRDESAFDLVKAHVLKHCQSSTGVEKIRPYISVSWEASDVE